MSLRQRTLRASKAIALKPGSNKRPRPLMASGAGCTASRRLHYSWATRRSFSYTNLGVHSVGNLSTLRKKYQDNNFQQQQQQQLRWNHSSDSSKKSDHDGGTKSTTANASEGLAPSSQSPSIIVPVMQSSPSITPKQTPKKRHRRRKSSSSNSHSPKMSQLFTTNKHQNALIPPPYSNSTILTRKQILRLTPKQRTALHKQRLQQHKDSISYLDTARTNVRSNLKFLGARADSNFQKNIGTLKRLFQGEEVWKDVPEPSSSTKQTREEPSSLAKGIDWERAPSEIKSNLQANLSNLQNWLHNATDGRIPSSSYTDHNGNGGSSTNNQGSGAGTSVATRMQQFHQMKQTNTLVMDNTWIAQNVAFAMLPGAIIGVYLWSLQDEMKGYYTRVERMEREKILGVMGDHGGGGGVAANNNNASSTSNSGKMGISHALIAEGGTAWDKMKMVVNDLVLGGAEERISKQKELQSKLVEEEEKKNSNHPSASSTSTTTADDSSTSSLNQHSAEGYAPPDKQPADVAASNEVLKDKRSSEEDPTIQMLLERIQALEKQVDTTSSGVGASNNTSEEELRHQQEEQRKKDHLLKYQLERLRQSPMANRRDNVLASQWRAEEEEKKRKEKEKEGTEGANGGRSYSLADVVNFAKLMVEPNIESMKESTLQKMKEVMSVLGLSEEEDAESSLAGHDTEEIASPPFVDDNTSSTDSSTLDSSSLQNEQQHKVTVESEPQVNSKSVIVKIVEESNSEEINNAAAAQTISEDVLHPHQDGSKKFSGVRQWAANLWRRIRKPPHALDGKED